MSYLDGNAEHRFSCGSNDTGFMSVGNYHMIERPGFNNKPPEAEEEWQDEEVMPQKNI